MRPISHAVTLLSCCRPSPDGEWLLRELYTQQNDLATVIVSRVDGSEATTLYSTAEIQLIRPSFDWREPHTLLIRYGGILATQSPNPTSLYSTYDPDTGIRTAGQLQPTTVPLGLLPFDVLSRQPYGTLEVLEEHIAGGALLPARYGQRRDDSDRARYHSMGLAAARRTLLLLPLVGQRYLSIRQPDSDVRTAN